jgi:hypothetical protein
MPTPSTPPPYTRADAARDLVTIIHATSHDAGEDNPLCEVRLGKNGLYYRFPPKLQAMSRLMKLMGWCEPEKIEVELKDNFIELLARIRRGDASPTPAKDSHPGHASPEKSSSSSSSSSESTAGVPPAVPQASGLLTPPSDDQHPESSNERPASSPYDKTAAIADLVTIIHARPSQATPDHPLCEARLTSWGEYHRFPSKLTAITLLTRMLGWALPEIPLVPHDPDAKFKQLAAIIRTRS